MSSLINDDLAAMSVDFRAIVFECCYRSDINFTQIHAYRDKIQSFTKYFETFLRNREM